MITFDHGKARFNFRVVGVALDGDRVLVHRPERDDFWTLPGGRGELLEPARDTLAREMLEEIGAEVQVGRLVWVVENFFQYQGIVLARAGALISDDASAGLAAVHAQRIRGDRIAGGRRDAEAHLQVACAG